MLVVNVIERIYAVSYTHLVGEATLKQGLKYIRNNPEKNLVNLAKWGGRLAKEPIHKQYARQWAEMFSDENNNWRNLAVKALNQLSPNVVEKTGINMFLNAGILSPARRRDCLLYTSEPDSSYWLAGSTELMP